MSPIEIPTLTPEQLLANGWEAADVESIESTLRDLAEIGAEEKRLEDEKSNHKSVIKFIIGNRQVRISHPVYGSCCIRKQERTSVNLDSFKTVLAGLGVSTDLIMEAEKAATETKELEFVEYRQAPKKKSKA